MNHTIIRGVIFLENSFELNFLSLDNNIKELLKTLLLNVEKKN